jgi:protocatechuate 3,4-dioxygenase beta subunit
VTRQAEPIPGAMDGEPHDHDRGLAFDLTTLMDRRQVIKLIAGASLVSLVGVACGGDDGGSTAAAGAATEDAAGAQTTVVSDESCEVIPEETAGPYPGDGTNGPNVLAETGIVRSDIRSSFGSSSGLADGVPLTVNLMVLDGANGCAAIEGAAVYLWHCDREGRYSLYSEGATDQNHLRGVQEADSGGAVSFTSIFPACYAGRWPHIHFEVYSSVDGATGGNGLVATSQLAFPADVCETVYATDGYSQSVTNLAQVSLESDSVFADGSELQLATMSGSVENGFAAELTVTV